MTETDNKQNNEMVRQGNAIRVAFQRWDAVIHILVKPEALTNAETMATLGEEASRSFKREMKERYDRLSGEADSPD